MAKLILAIMIFTASACNAAPFIGAWEITEGAEYVRIFKTDVIPESHFYPALAVKGREHEILVFPGRLDHPLDSAVRWQPQGRPPGIYVFMLNMKSGEVSLLTLDSFIKQETIKEDFKRVFCTRYPELRYTGKETGYAVMNLKNGRKFIAAESCNTKTKKKTTFGIPSLLPFMGRQSLFESIEYYSGTVFLEVFDIERPLKPIVRFKQVFRDLEVPLLYGINAEWVQGAEKPLLILVEKGIPEKGEPGKIFLIDCTFR